MSVHQTAYSYKCTPQLATKVVPSVTVAFVPPVRRPERPLNTVPALLQNVAGVGMLRAGNIRYLASGPCMRAEH